VRRDVILRTRPLCPKDRAAELSTDSSTAKNAASE
jgi:hypothetical protein